MSPRQPPPGSADEWPRLPLRRRLLVLALAASTAGVVAWLLLARPGDPKHDALRAHKAAQAASATAAPASAVGGKADVLLVPSAPASSSR